MASWWFTTARLRSNTTSRAPTRRYGTAIPNATFSADTLHDVRSVTKSVTSLCLGIALDHGWVKSLEAPVISFFPEWTDLRTAEKDGITLRHLLTMSAGLDWNENVPYTDPTNSEIRMDRAPDPYRFAFEQPAMVSPGEVYNYSGGDTNLISAVLRQATGRSIEQLAKDELFDPLGITAVHWYHFSNGDPIAASGLRLRPRDMAKLGQLMLNHGQWGGRQVVSAAYVDAAITPQINGQGLFFYGYQFWLGRSFVNGREIDWAAAVGLGGQRIFIVPALDLVTVVTAGLYNDNLQGPVPLVDSQPLCTAGGPEANSGPIDKARGGRSAASPLARLASGPPIRTAAGAPPHRPARRPARAPTDAARALSSVSASSSFARPKRECAIDRIDTRAPLRRQHRLVGLQQSRVSQQPRHVGRGHCLPFALQLRTRARPPAAARLPRACATGRRRTTAGRSAAPAGSPSASPSTTGSIHSARYSETSQATIAEQQPKHRVPPVQPSRFARRNPSVVAPLRTPARNRARAGSPPRRSTGSA